MFLFQLEYEEDIIDSWKFYQENIKIISLGSLPQSDIYIRHFAIEPIHLILYLLDTKKVSVKITQNKTKVYYNGKKKIAEQQFTLLSKNDLLEFDKFPFILKFKNVY